MENVIILVPMVLCKLDGVRANGYDYYLGTDGVVQTGIQHIDGKIYYFGPLGPVQSRFTHVDGKPYYFDASHESKNGLDEARV